MAITRTAGERGHADGDRESEAIDGARGLYGRRAASPRERRTNQVGQPFEDVDAHGALAADTVAGGAIKHFRNVLVGGDRRAAAGGKLLDRFEPLRLGAAMLERPQLRRQQPAARA